MSTESQTFVRQISVIISYALSIYATFYWFLFRHRGSHYQTPFTGFLPVTMAYWIITSFLQLVFLGNYYFKPTSTTSTNSTTINSKVDGVVGYHFIISNVLNFFWAYFFKKQSFLISEILLIVNFFNLSSLYFIHKTFKLKSLKEWLTIHLPVTSLPLAWTIYAIFWNGATLFHSHNKSIVPRLLANILIWEFLVVPFIFLIFYRDWSFGLATSLLAFGLFAGQFTSRLIAFQWAFALVIASLDLILSVLVMLGVGVGNSTSNSFSNEQAPLLT